MTHLLTMTKPLGEICPITMGETLYRFTSHILCIQFYEIFATHFSPHQFWVVIKNVCETIIHNIKCTLELHPNWVILQVDVANTFNSVSRGVIFLKLHEVVGDIIQSIPYVHAFNAFKPPLFYSHRNHESDVTIIPFAMGTHQGDPWGGDIRFSPF